MALYGYARVSSRDQDFAVQEQALRAAGCAMRSGPRRPAGPAAPAALKRTAEIRERMLAAGLPI